MFVGTLGPLWGFGPAFGTQNGLHNRVNPRNNPNLANTNNGCEKGVKKIHGLVRLADYVDRAGRPYLVRLLRDWLTFRSAANRRGKLRYIGV